MSDTHEKLTRLLARDPGHEAEQITGRRGGEDDATALLGMALHLQRNDEARALLDAAGDAHMSEAPDSYRRILAAEGFREVFSEPFVGRHGDPETLDAWWHQDGVLLVFDTFLWAPGQPHVNTAAACFNWRSNDPAKSWDCPIACSRAGTQAGVVAGSFDAREAPRTKLAQLRATGDLLNPWETRPFFMRFSNYAEIGGSYELLKVAEARRLELLPEDVRQAITPEARA